MNYSQEDKQLRPDPTYTLLGEKKLCHTDVIKVMESRLVLYLRTIWATCTFLILGILVFCCFVLYAGNTFTPPHVMSLTFGFVASASK